MTTDFSSEEFLDELFAEPEPRPQIQYTDRVKQPMLKIDPRGLIERSTLLLPPNDPSRRFDDPWPFYRNSCFNLLETLAR